MDYHQKITENFNKDFTNIEIMLLEGYLAKMKSYPADELKVVVTRTAHSILAPSMGLLEDYKNEKIDWTEYEKRYKYEIYSNQKAIEYIGTLVELSKIQNVRLICYEKKYPCHRFILMNIMREVDALKGINVNFDYAFSVDGSNWTGWNRSNWE
jgi:uncharacterized protein YeaO (DUF488 family)